MPSFPAAQYRHVRVNSYGQFQQVPGPMIDASAGAAPRRFFGDDARPSTAIQVPLTALKLNRPASSGSSSGSARFATRTDIIRARGSHIACRPGGPRPVGKISGSVLSGNRSRPLGMIEPGETDRIRPITTSI